MSKSSNCLIGVKTSQGIRSILYPSNGDIFDIVPLYLLTYWDAYEDALFVVKSMPVEEKYLLKSDLEFWDLPASYHYLFDNDLMWKVVWQDKDSLEVKQADLRRLFTDEGYFHNFMDGYYKDTLDTHFKAHTFQRIHQALKDFEEKAKEEQGD